MLGEQIGEGLIGQLLQIGHAVAPKLRQLGERVVIEGDQLAHKKENPVAPRGKPRAPEIVPLRNALP